MKKNKLESQWGWWVPDGGGAGLSPHRSLVKTFLCWYWKCGLLFYLVSSVECYLTVNCIGIQSLAQLSSLSVFHSHGERERGQWRWERETTEKWRERQRGLNSLLEYRICSRGVDLVLGNSFSLYSRKYIHLLYPFTRSWCSLLCLVN